MQTIWDLLPASLWPTQPFIPPPSVAHATAWPQAAAPGWTQTVPSRPPDWPAAPAGGTDDDGSVSEWDRAVRRAFAARRDATRDADIDGLARSYQMLADAKRAHDFVVWAFGPPSAPQAPGMNDMMLRRASQYLGGAPQNFVAANAAWSPTLAAAGDDAGAAAAAPADIDQQPDLGAAYGNPNIERQGARARALAAMRLPSALVGGDVGAAAADADAGGPARAAPSAPGGILGAIFGETADSAPTTRFFDQLPPTRPARPAVPVAPTPGQLGHYFPSAIRAVPVTPGAQPTQDAGGAVQIAPRTAMRGGGAADDSELPRSDVPRSSNMRRLSGRGTTSNRHGSRHIRMRTGKRHVVSISHLDLRRRPRLQRPPIRRPRRRSHIFERASTRGRPTTA
jgi:hypothetical protein